MKGPEVGELAEELTVRATLWCRALVALFRFILEQ